MRSITKHVERSTAEQANGGRQITKSIEAISSKVQHLGTTHKQQRQDIDKIREFAMRIEYLSRNHEQLLTRVKTSLVDVENALTDK